MAKEPAQKSYSTQPKKQAKNTKTKKTVKKENKTP